VIFGICLLLALAACGWSAPTARYRYKLTLSVDTPEGVKTANSVVEIDYYHVDFPMGGEPHEVHGQALYLDLGKGRKPLVVLLNRRRRLGDDGSQRGWNDDSPANIFANKCHLSWDDGQAALAEQFGNCKGPIELKGDDLPDIVIFDPANPDLAKSVNPDDHTIDLGQDLHWLTLTIEITDEDITKGIEEHMSLQPYKEKIVHISGLDPCCGYSPVISVRSLLRK
jgi:hypothetical protein